MPPPPGNRTLFNLIQGLFTLHWWAPLDRLTSLTTRSTKKKRSQPGWPKSECSTGMCMMTNTSITALRFWGGGKLFQSCLPLTGSCLLCSNSLLEYFLVMPFGKQKKTMFRINLRIDFGKASKNFLGEVSGICLGNLWNKSLTWFVSATTRGRFP